MAKERAGIPEPVTPFRFARHGVIEASAGTGKTFTIVEMVKDLVCRENASLEQILILTFTEKAAAELRERIHAGLLSARDQAVGPAHRRALARAVQEFHRATIGTLHGFCHRVLREFSFETGLHFSPTVVDDGPLLREQLQHIQRDLWPAWHGAELPEVLALSSYPQASGSRSKWEDRALHLARLVQPRAGDRMLPERRALTGLRNAFLPLRAYIEQLFRILEFASDPSCEAWVQTLAADAKVHGSSKAKFTRTLLAMLSSIPGLRDALAAVPGEAPAAFAKCADTVNREDVDYLAGRVTAKATPAAAELMQTLCGALGRIAEVIDDLREQLTVQTVETLQTNARAYKLERGLISFADMLGLLHEQLVGNPGAGNPGQAAPLAVALRRRYRYALVDEFQDTDPIQWEILQALFVTESNRHAGKLFIIGDPKQSIYRFRGADVATYLKARQTLSPGEPPRALRVNWRSTPELIGVVNRLFGGDPANHLPPWFPDGQDIAFMPVAAPPLHQRRFVVTQDRSGRSALTICQLPAGRSGEQHWTYAHWMAREIRRLIDSPEGGLEFRETSAGAQPQRLNASHIAILVKARKHVALVQRALEAAGVPSTSYRQTGLFSSEEAAELLYLLQTIETPAHPQRLRKALMTRFFGYRPEELAAFAGFAPGHRIPELLQRWSTWAGERRWTRLFASMEEDTGVLERDLAAFDGDRRLTNLKHLMEFLAAEAFGRKLSLPGVIRTLQAAQRDADEIEVPADRQRVDTERPRVKIMTIHVSKGLQFPVVFLFDPPGKSMQRDPWYKFHQNGHMTYDLARNPAHKDLDAHETAEENLRLCYVAMTRAMFKLYLPCPESKDMNKAAEAEMAPGIAVPAARLLTLFPPDNPDAIGPDVTWVSAAPNAAAGVLPAVDPATTPLPRLEPAARPDPRIAERKVAIESFTHLSRTARNNASPVSSVPAYGERDPRDYDEDALRELPLAADSPEDAAALAAGLNGREFGTLLHAILESVDFAAVGRAPDAGRLPAEVLALIDRELRSATGGRPIAPVVRGEVARLVFNALRSPLPLRTEQVPLVDIPSGDRIAELEFQYRIQPADNRPTGEMQIHGFMDLLFRRRDPGTGILRYYLLDWKTNRLSDGYACASLQRSMAEENYTLQHQLYTLALAKWLRSRLANFDFERQFGGVIYLYLRGMTGQPDSPGIYVPETLSVSALVALEASLAGSGSAGQNAVFSGGLA